MFETVANGCYPRRCAGIIRAASLLTASDRRERAGQGGPEGADAGFWSSFCQGASDASDRSKRSVGDAVALCA